MKPKLSEAKNSIENEKRGTLGGHQTELSPFPGASKLSRAAKSSVDYWKAKVRPRLLRDGKPTPELYVRLKEGSSTNGGRDAWVCLDTANKATAATKARDLWLAVRAKGIDQALAEFRPKAAPRAPRIASVGEVITAAQALSTTRPQSFAQAAMRLRQIAAELAGVERPVHATAYRSPGFAAWREKVDALPISRITPVAVRGWRDARIAARSANHVERRAATVSADATIRMARSIFAKRILAAGLGAKVNLPSPLPFAGVTLGGSTKRFSERIDAERLFAAARRDLEAECPEVFRAFVLCLLAGLRRSEADRLMWAQLDLDGASLSIERTEYFEPKSEESNRQVELDPVAVEILRRAKSENPDPVFVLKGSVPKPQTSAAPVYRADAAPWRTWERLVAWLGAQGIQDGKPIHVLRKLAGSLVFSAHGLEQARGFLGHASVVTTSNSYVSKARRVTVSIPPLADEVSLARAKGRAQA
jgi:integrase